jgi:hypothetical protein
VDAYYISRRRTQHTPKRDKGATMPDVKLPEVDRVFDAYLKLNSDEQRIFSAMLRGREKPAPAAQSTIPMPAANKRSHKGPQKPAPAAPQPAEQAEAKTA